MSFSSSQFLNLEFDFSSPDNAAKLAMAVQAIPPDVGDNVDDPPKTVRGTAPEHAEAIVGQTVADVFFPFSELYASQFSDGYQMHHLFDSPAKSEVVRMAHALAGQALMEPSAAQARVEEWAASAQAQRGCGNEDKVVLSLFDKTGKWAQPWVEAGYDVHLFDKQTDDEMGDVTKFSTEFFDDWFGQFDGQEIYAILAATPCTDFASSGSRHFSKKDQDGRTAASIRLVHATLAAIEYFKPAIWALENPVGRIGTLGGLPDWRLAFDPCHFGDTYTKKTLLWGRFNPNLPGAPVFPSEGSKMHSQYGGSSIATKNARSATPMGFAYAFFAANNIIDNPSMSLAAFDRLDPALRTEAAKHLDRADVIEAISDAYFLDIDDNAAEAAIRGMLEAHELHKVIGAVPHAPHPHQEERQSPAANAQPQRAFSFF